MVDPSMAEATEAYLEDHKASSDLGRLALHGGVVSVAMQHGNGALQLAAASWRGNWRRGILA